MTEQEKRMHRCAFTGHRPEKLNLPECEVRKLLRQAIEQAYIDGFNVFISGMARGVDYAKKIVMRSESAKTASAVEVSKKHFA